MIEQTNITIEKTNIIIHSKETKKIICYLNLDDGYWIKWEYNNEFKETYCESTNGIMKNDR